MTKAGPAAKDPASNGKAQKNMLSFFQKRTPPKAKANRPKDVHPEKLSKKFEAADVNPALSELPLLTPKAKGGASLTAVPESPQLRTPSPLGQQGRQVAGQATNTSTPVTDGHALNEVRAVGSRVKIFWPLDKIYYPGEVVNFDAKTGKHEVLYEDGTQEFLLLEEEKVIWLPDEQVLCGKKRVLSDDEDDVPTRKARITTQKRRVAYISEESDEEEQSEEEWTVEKEPVPSVDEDFLDGVEEEAVVFKPKKVKRPSPKKRAQDDTPVRPPRKTTPSIDTPSLVAPALKVVENRSFKPTGAPKAARGAAVEKEIVEKTVNEKVQSQSLGDRQPMGEAAARFGGRIEEFPFLKDRKDAQGRRPNEPDYDSTSLYIPPAALKKLSPGQRQWWELKSKHMDKVLLFKMGKFYEMFEMDAHIGAQDLNLEYMKKVDQPHCGFPEKNFAAHAETLARKGHRVLVVEQTETPEQLKERKARTGSKDTVVRREVVAVLTKGTLVESSMLAAHPDASYLLSICELEVDTPSKAIIGICAADTATGRFMLGQFLDDSHRGRLRSILTDLRPVELIKPRGTLSESTERALRDHTRQPLINLLQPGTQFWDAQRTLKDISQYFKESLPPVLRQLAAAGAQGSAALSAFGGTVCYLRQALLDQDLLVLGKVEWLPGTDSVGGEGKLGQSVDDGEADFMVLDSAALENLEILENSKDGGLSGTLLSQLDHCVTPFGRRLLRNWLCRPLARVSAITARQEAIAELKTGPGMEAASAVRQTLQSVPDLERLLARLHTISSGSGRDAEKVVLYEDEMKKRLSEFVSVLRGCRSLLSATSAFDTCRDDLSSPLLRNLVTPGQAFPAQIAPALDTLAEAFDWQAAEKTGRVVPRGGVDQEFDESAEGVAEVDAELEAHLTEQRKRLGAGSDVVYVSVNKDQFLLEVPERLWKKVPNSWVLKASRKGFRRYHTHEIIELLKTRAAAEELREAALKGIFKGLLLKFCQNSQGWQQAVHSISQLDCLISLAQASVFSNGSMCRPSFSPPTPPPSGPETPPWLSAKNLRHPILGGSGGGALAMGGSFVPNDTCLGEPAGAAPFLLLTGPNMGGKSTLLRQVCLAVVMAQIGADVPAEALSLSPADRIFVRMGAKDNIMAGQSTFLVELSETATMLRCATRHSLVALDELGRGTATSDGAAIAYAVLQHLVHQTGCRGLFSTHYHRLADEHKEDPGVSLRHMGCQVSDGGVKEVLFLYKLVEGACPTSYGTNVARLAGMPDAVIARAEEKAAELEEQVEAIRKAKGNVKAASEALESPPEELACLSNIARMLDRDLADCKKQPVELHKNMLALWKETQSLKSGRTL